MENQSNSLLSSSDEVLSIPFSGDGEVSDSYSFGFWSILGAVVFIILILAMSGVNIFSYLAVGTQDAANWFQSMADTIKKYTGTFHISDGLGNVVGLSALGTKEIIDNVSKDVNYISSSIDNTAEKVLDPIIKKTVKLKGVPLSQTITPSNNTENNSLNRALNTQNALEDGASGAKGSNYSADDSVSPIQKNSGKSGWCYIGDDNGTRTCAKVGENQMCMSGDIFPTSEICVNPNLRM